MAYRNTEKTEFRKLHDKNFKVYMNSRLALYFNNYDLDCPSPPYPDPPTDTSSSAWMNRIREWYLVQLDNSKMLLIVSKHDLLLTVNRNEIQKWSKIQFKRNDAIHLGYVLNFADERNELEDESRRRLTNIVKLNSILTTASDNSKLISAEKQRHNTATFDASRRMGAVVGNQTNYQINWFLVQFERSDYCVVHAIINEHKIRWDLHDSRHLTNNQGLYIIDGNNTWQALVLYASESRNDVVNQLSSLTSVAFNMLFDDPEKSKAYNSWLLITYNSNADDSDNIEYSYAIINESITVYQRQNVYPDVVVFFRDDQRDLLYQAVVLKKSVRRDDLEFDLENLRTNTQLTLFPLDEQALISNSSYKMERRNFINNLNFEYLKFDRSVQTDFAYPVGAPLRVDVETESKEPVRIMEEERDYTEEEMELIRKVNMMEEKMNAESRILRDAFCKLDRINSNMDREIMTLEYLISLPDIL